MTEILYQFDNSDTIDRFIPKIVSFPSHKNPGQEWVNGPLVWAVNRDEQKYFLFPNQCPRLFISAKSNSTIEDINTWLDGYKNLVLVYLEQKWVPILQKAIIYRYQLPTKPFDKLKGSEIWVSKSPITPLQIEMITDLPQEIKDHGIKIKPIKSLVNLEKAWFSSLKIRGYHLKKIYAKINELK